MDHEENGAAAAAATSSRASEEGAAQPQKAAPAAADVPSDLVGAAAALAQAAERNRRRAERFNIAAVAPNPFNEVAAPGISRSDAKRLLRVGHAEPGLATGAGFETGGELDAKRAARSARFGVTTFDADRERARVAGLSEEERALRAERRARAARFGKADELDVELARAAAVSLTPDPVVDALIAGGDAPPALRPNALHVRGCGYLPAATGDLRRFFGDFRPSHIQWLNGISLNVIFHDAGTAARALELFSEPVPAVPDVPPVWGGWRVCLKPLEKVKTDKYAPAGTLSTIYLRVATALDVPELAPGTTGPRTHGSYSTHGEFSLRRLHTVEMDEDEGDGGDAPAGPAGAAGGGGAAAAADAPALAPAAAAAALAYPVYAAPASLAAVGAAAHFAEVLRRAAGVAGAEHRARPLPASGAGAATAAARGAASITSSSRRRREAAAAGGNDVDMAPTTGGKRSRGRMEAAAGGAEGGAEAEPAQRVRGRGRAKAPRMDAAAAVCHADTRVEAAAATPASAAPDAAGGVFVASLLGTAGADSAVPL